MKNDCLFCAIAAGEIPCFKVYEDEKALAFLDINPFSTGHTLVIPKEHSEGIVDMPAESLKYLIDRVQFIAGRLKESLGCSGFNILQNNGESAGQTVKHVHFHIVPRYGEPDGARIAFENQSGDMQELAALAGRVKID